MTAIETFSALPTPVKLWLFWMLAVQVWAVVYIKHAIARWVLLALLANLVAMMVVHRQFGPGPHMSIPHVLFWSPLLWSLVRAHRLRAPNSGHYSLWLKCLSLSIAVSLVMDYYKIGLLLARL